MLDQVEREQHRVMVAAAAGQRVGIPLERRQGSTNPERRRSAILRNMPGRQSKNPANASPAGSCALSHRGATCRSSILLSVRTGPHCERRDSQMTKNTKRTNISEKTELLSDADLNAVSGGMMNQDTALFRAFVAGAARGYGGELCIGNVLIVRKQHSHCWVSCG